MRHMEQLATAQNKPELRDLAYGGAHEIITVFKDFAQGGIYGKYVDAAHDRFQPPSCRQS